MLCKTDKTGPNGAAVHGLSSGISLLAAGAFTVFSLSQASADPLGSNASMMPMPFSMSTAGGGPDAHGENGGHAAIPAGVTGAGMVAAGHVMVTYEPMFMHMQDNYIGTSQVPDSTILNTKLPMPMMMNGMTMTNYRIVPTTMDVQSHMLHVMYGVTDWLDIMVMGSFVQKSMTMKTYNMMGTAVVGTTTNTTGGFGDTMVSSLWRLYQDPIHHLHLNLGLSLPSGSTTQQMSMLMPMGTFMTMRANYGMQLGTGTVDFMPGLSYTGHLQQWSWGLIYRGRFPLGDNAQGYRYGNSNEWSGWGGYTWIPGVTTTFRAVGSIQDQIHGSDPSIMGIMQGTNPNFYGGKHIDLLGGIELDGAPLGLGPNLHLDVEGGSAVYQDLNGPQLGRDWQLIVAARLGF